MAEDLFPCRWRGPEQDGVYPCSSVKLIAPNGVTAAVCHKCPYKNHEPVPNQPATDPALTAQATAKIAQLKARVAASKQLRIGDADALRQLPELKSIGTLEVTDSLLQAAKAKSAGAGDYVETLRRFAMLCASITAIVTQPDNIAIAVLKAEPKVFNCLDATVRPIIASMAAATTAKGETIFNYGQFDLANNKVEPCDMLVIDVVAGLEEILAVYATHVNKFIAVHVSDASKSEEVWNVLVNLGNVSKIWTVASHLLPQGTFTVLSRT